MRKRHTLGELLVEAAASGAYPLPRDEREWIDAPSAGREVGTQQAVIVDNVPVPVALLFEEGTDD